jgi:hypothetical protein
MKNIRKNIAIIRNRFRRNSTQLLVWSRYYTFFLDGYKIKDQKQKVNGLTTAQKVARMKNCRQLLAWHAKEKVIFSCEILFLLQKTQNLQNDYV